MIQNLNYGGMERVLADIVRGVDTTRFEMHVLAMEYLGRFAQGLDTASTLHLAPPLSRWSMLRPSELTKQITRIAPDVVHTHSGVWYKASLAARMAGVPRLIHTEHGRRKPDPAGDRIIDRLGARRTDVVVAVSEALSSQLRTSRIVSAAKIRVVPNGIDTDVFRPHPYDGALHRRLGLGDEVPVIGSIGRLEPIKGYAVMIDAMERLIADSTDAPAPVLVVVGEGSERSELEQRIVRRGLQGRVFLLGWRDDIHELHAAFALFTMSSHSEGTSISLLEALSAELCPVVTDVGGNRAVLGEDLRHRLVPPGDASALASAWRTALANPQTRTADARLARRRVERHFNLRNMVADYEQLYGYRT